MSANPLFDKVAEKLVETKARLSALAGKTSPHRDKVVSQVTVSQVLGGMRGIKALLCDTSEVDPNNGVVIRGIPIEKLSSALPEETFWLLLTGRLPDPNELTALQADLAARSAVPEYVWKCLEALPADTHPMTLFCAGLSALQYESIFAKQYEAGLRKEDYWRSTLDDSIGLLAKITGLAAGVYGVVKGRGPRVAPAAPGKDWSASFTEMLGIPGEGFAKLMRLYLTLHSDHEGGNVSAHAAHCVGSALSDPYRSVVAGLQGLAGPLHGLANQECLNWVRELQSKCGACPTRDQVEQTVLATIQSGQVVPGYGHAVLRATDPRFTAFLKFGEQNCGGDPAFECVKTLYQVVPTALRTHKPSIANPYPNVDAISGSLLNHYGLSETNYYTVLFGVSRALGLCAQLVWSRAIEEPIERPKSVTTEWLESFVKQS